MNKVKTRTVIVLILIFVGLMFGLCKLNFKNTIEIFYQADNSNAINHKIVEAFFDVGEGYTNDEGSYSVTEISKRHASLKCADDIKNVIGIRIDFTSDAEIVKVKKVVVRCGIFSVKTYDPVILLENATFLNTANVSIGNNALIIEPAIGDPECIFNQTLVEEFCNSVERYSPMNYVFIGILGIVIYLIAVIGILKYNFIKEIEDNKFYAVGCLLVFLSAILVFVMALFSRNYGHPDEDVTAAAIDYYLKYSNIPDFTTQEALDSFSNYGSSRLKELTVYYFIAGKLGWVLKNIFHIFTYYRGLNVLLFWLMCGMYFKWGKRCPWMVLGILFTPQLWYLFSYATSDAWDYFLSFVAIFMILNVRSNFNEALKENSVFYKLRSIIFEGGIFGLLFLGKQNYYVVFILGFAILLSALIKSKASKKMVMLKKYILVLAVFGGVIGFRISIDNMVYNGQKDEQLCEIQQEVVGEAQIEAISAGLNLREKGVTLPYLFNEYGFFEKTYKSFCGYYGWLSEQSSFIYYLLVFSVYVCMILSQIKTLIICDDWMLRVNYCIAWLIMILSCGISLMNSWINDFQAQGRYIMPILFCIMWIGQMVGDEASKKNLIYCYVLAILSCFSFVLSGIVNLV